MQVWFEQCVAAQELSGHVTHESVTGQSASTLHEVPHTGVLSWQVSIASQYMTTVGANVQSGPLQGAQMSPQLLPSQGLVVGHVSMPFRHCPASQRAQGHAIVPSSQVLQAALLTGQSESAVHSPGQAGNDVTQAPFTQSAVAHAVVPSEQTLHTSGTAQLLALWHIVPPHEGWPPGWHCPLASQYFTTAVSAHIGSFGAHCVQVSPQALPAHGS
jgi:hypothetical protein